MITLTDKNGNLFPAVRNLVNLIWLTFGFVAGWGGHIVWNRQAESDQLVNDAREMLEIRAETQENKQVLDENIENSKGFGADCNDLQFYVEQLRRNRTERPEFNE